MPRRPGFAPLAAALLSSAACVPLPGHGYAARQLVVRKEGEDTLVAASGATCRVTGDTYEKVQVGDEHVCAWQYADDASPPGGKTDPRPRRAPAVPRGS